MPDDAIKRRRSIGLLMEQFGPPMLSAASFVALLAVREGVQLRFGAGGWKAEGLYTAVFNWAAIQTGFAFGVYGFVAGKSDGFVEAVRNTVAMSRFLRYVKVANIAGFLLTIFSIPLLIVNPNLSTSSSMTYALVSAWFALFVWAFLSFLRIAHTFGRLSSVSDTKPFIGAGS